MQSVSRIAPIEAHEPYGVWRFRSVAAARWFHDRLARRPGTRSLVALRASDSTTLPHGEGRTLTCKRGTAWVTQLGVYEDFILHTGQSVRTAPRGSVVVTAVGDVELEIVP
jgi:hypothetical protein